MESGVFGVLDVAVTLGFAFESVASKLTILVDGSVLRTCRIIPTVWCGAIFVEADMIRYCHLRSTLCGFCGMEM